MLLREKEGGGLSKEKQNIICKIPQEDSQLENLNHRQLFQVSGELSKNDLRLGNSYFFFS